MKSSLVRSFVIFTAGAATAAVASGLYQEQTITAGEFQERAIVLLAEVEALGKFVAVTEKGRVGIFGNPDAACMPPKPPVPVIPVNSVDLRTLEPAIKALKAINVGFLMGDKAPVYLVEACKPVEGFKGG